MCIREREKTQDAIEMREHCQHFDNFNIRTSFLKGSISRLSIIEKYISNTFFFPITPPFITTGSLNKNFYRK